MIEIQVAGAGAGKTYGMAEKIIERYDPDTHKDIFAITYTNSATRNIEEKIIEQFGFVPENIKICTVHTFFLNEIIYPFAPSILGVIYTAAARCSLQYAQKKGQTKTKADLAREKAIIIKRLKDKQILHVEDVYSVARKVVDPSHSAHNSKIKRARIHRVLDLLNSCIDKIFVDEAQDLDDAALKAIKALGEHGIDIYMVGDPKQAIKYPDAFKEFLKSNSDLDNISVLPCVNESRRVPQNIINLSNTFCPKGQEQNSLSEIEGRLLYIVSSDEGYEDFLNCNIDNGNLVCIYSKTGDYSTCTADSTVDIHPDINELLVEHHPEYDEDLVMGAASSWLSCKSTVYSVKHLINRFFEEFRIPYSPKTYAQLLQAVNSYDSAITNKAKYHISSITRTKGLEADINIIVITKGIYRFLTKDRLKQSEEHNKTWNMVYVALTRTRSDLIVAIDEQIINGNPSKDDVISGLEKLGFTKLGLE